MSSLKIDKARLQKAKFALQKFEKKASSKNSPWGKEYSPNETEKLIILETRIAKLEDIITSKEANAAVSDLKTKQQAEVFKNIVSTDGHKYLDMSWKLEELDHKKISNVVGKLGIRLRFKKFSFANTAWWVLDHVETTSKIQSGGININASVSSFASAKNSMLQTELNIKITLSTGGITFTKNKVSTESLKKSLNVSLKKSGVGLGGGWEWTSGKQESWQTAQSAAGASFTRDIRYKFQSQDGRLNCKVLEKENVRVNLFNWGQSKTVKSILEKLYADDFKSEVELMDLIERMDDSRF